MTKLQLIFGIFFLCALYCSVIITYLLPLFHLLSRIVLSMLFFNQRCSYNLQSYKVERKFGFFGFRRV
ncbi:hypothetical protein HanPI659440_Chr16g0637581 [Helianthus annuus]|nr:hypothetical protein HanPI659440_Chr16g0637581 [Helianthus annuus]